MEADSSLITLASEYDPERGNRLKNAMRDTSCKAEELAHLCRVSTKTVGRWRKGDTIKRKYVPIICQRCETDEGYLLAGIQNEPDYVKTMTDDTYQPDREFIRATSPEERLAINHIPINRYQVALLRHIRTMPEPVAIRMLNRIINNRWKTHVEPYQTGKPVLDGVSLDHYEVAAILALRAIESPGKEIDLIGQLLDTKGSD